MIVAGVGCRRGTSAEEIERVVLKALATFNERREDAIKVIVEP